MAVTYCTSDNVAQFLQIAVFDGSSTPTKTVVEEIINQMEDFIDQETQHAFRTTTVTEEYHDQPSHYESPHAYDTFDGVPIYLGHREIILLNGQLDTGNNDKLEIFDGANWIDWTANFTDGRGDDFWVEPEKGILWLRSTTYAPRRRSVRITYRYGASSVPNDIKRAAILLSAAEILSNEDYSIKLPEGNDGIPHETRAANWEKRAMRILGNRSEISIPVAHG